MRIAVIILNMCIILEIHVLTESFIYFSLLQVTVLRCNV